MCALVLINGVVKLSRGTIRKKVKADSAPTAGEIEAIRRATATRPWLLFDSKAGAFRVNNQQLPVPDRLMVSNWVAVWSEQGSGEVTVGFGQAAPDVPPTGLLMLLVTLNDAKYLAASAHEKFVAGLQSHLSSLGLSSQSQLRQPTELRQRGEIRQLVERGSHFQISYLGNSAELWVYRSSAQDLQRLKAGVEADLLQPVVRIDLSSVKLLALMKKVDELLANGGGA